MGPCRQAALALALVLGVSWPVAAATKGQALVAAADALLHGSSPSTADLEAAIAKLEAGIKAGLPPAARAAAHAQQALAWLRLGERAGDKAGKMASFARGQQAAEAGLAVDPRCAYCHFFQGANLGRYVEAEGNWVKALGQVKAMRAAFEAALRYDPGHLYARVALAQIEARVPGFMGGDVRKAEALYRDALRQSPRFTRAKVELAELLYKAGRKAEALGLARAAHDEARPAFPSEFQRVDRARAARLLAEWK